MTTGLGFTVLRSIPLEFITGVAQKIYTVHGGVIRDHGGRIVAHLSLPEVSAGLDAIPGLGIVGQVAQAYQLQSLSADVQKVLSLSLASTALSGLGLATSLAGFAYLSRRLNAIDGRIAGIANWLSTASEGQLRAAASDLAHASRTPDPQMRTQLLVYAKSTFTSLAHHYRSQADAARSVSELEVFEDCCVTAMTGAAMSTSDLGLHEAAAEDMKRFRSEWVAMARRQLRRLLDLDNATRLLDGRYVKLLPTAELVPLLEFATGEARGLAWIDDLRKGYGTTTALATGLRTVGDDALACAKRLRARDDVLASYEEHFALLGARQVAVSEFAELLRRETSGDEVAVLVPDASTAV